MLLLFFLFYPILQPWLYLCSFLVLSLFFLFYQGVNILVIFSLFSHLSCSSMTHQCHPLAQPDCPHLLLLSHHFFLCSLFRSCTTLVLVLSIRTHTLCFVSTLYLCSPLTLLSPSLFISPLTFCSLTDLAGCPDSSRQWSRLDSQRVCLPKDCLWGLRISCRFFFSCETLTSLSY